jgi:2'-5' RNA ligase
MKLIAYFLAFGWLSLGEGILQLNVSKEIFGNVTFVEHPDYLAMAVSFSAVSRLHEQLEKRLGRSLLSRPEAHVTVITPPEWAKLRQHLTVAEINKIALDSKIQSLPWKVVGLGSGRVRLEGVLEETYFILIRSEGLLTIRRKIAQKYQLAGGAPKDFVADHFFPHITIAFTKRDLHEGDGVVKSVEKSQDSRFKLSVE